MSYDPLRRRTEEARDHLKSAIRKAQADKLKATTELELLWNLEAMLNLDAIVDAIPVEHGGEA